MAQNVQQQLEELGSKLESPPSTKDGLLKILKQSALCLAELDQCPSASLLESMKPFLNAIVKPELLQHQDKDVKLLVATCTCEITRITAPEAPYSDDVLKDIFGLVVGTFSGLSDTSGPSFGRRVVILETLAKYRSCVVMLDLECDDLVNEMFSTFLAVARDDHPESIISSMENIMVVLLEESEDVPVDLLSVILSALGRKSGFTTAARRLAMNVVRQCAGKLEPGIKQILISSISGDSKPMNCQIQYHEVIYDLYRCAPQILSGIVPQITGELLTDQLETRLQAVSLVGDIFALPGSAIPEAFQPIFSEFLKRLTDRMVGVRMSVLEHVKNCLLSNPSRSEGPLIISALSDRLLDFDENVRKQVLAVICDVASHDKRAIPIETVKLVAERLRDKSLLVKKYTMDRLAELYRVHCENCINFGDFDWIPGKLLRCLYDKDFRSDTIDFVLCGSLFPPQISIGNIVKHWIQIYLGLDKVEVKALERVLEQKQRLLQEMQKYLSLRQIHQDKDVPEKQKKILFCFRAMSRSFADPLKAEESFQILDQLKDANVWQILSTIVDPDTGLHQSHALRDDLLKIIGEKHRLYDFLNTLAVKCSYLLFNKEHVKALLSEVLSHKTAGNAECISSCMNILVILAHFCPLLFIGSEEELVNLLKDDNDIIKEGILHVLAMAGTTIREKLATLSSSIDLILERLCLEGSRRQAKYAVHALAAITKDDGLKSLSVLCKRLVDMLEEKTHLPAVLQSLGCIAETAMPVFETRESEIEDFIVNKILKCNAKLEDDSLASWDDCSDDCLLKIYGMKTLVKSYLPVKDAHVRSGIDRILDILRNMLSFGEISKDVQSSSVDKAHLRLASAKAILRLSRLWDDKIPIDMFHLTLRTPEICFPEAKRIFLNKVHQYIKDRLLDAKYACSFFFGIFGTKPNEYAEYKHNLADIIQMHYQAKARQFSVQSEGNSLTFYPEYIIPYLIHAIAHHECPNIDETKDVKAFELIYRQLHLVLSMLLQREEDVKPEASNAKEKDNAFTICCILQSIKISEDVVDSTKSKKSHAICDLGLAITKRLVQKEVHLQEVTSSVSIPPMLYKTYESKDGDNSQANKERSWLTDESALAHFESLDLEKLPSEYADDDDQKENERDVNEMPLGKMLKHIKYQRTRDKKQKKKYLPAEKKNAENDIDILEVVRELNIDNFGISMKSEPSHGHEFSPSKSKVDIGDVENGDNSKAGKVASVPLPKRQRSSAAKSPRSTSKVPRANLGDGLLQSTQLDFESDKDEELLWQKKKVKGQKSDLLVSSLKPKVKVSDHSNEANELGGSSNDDMEEHDDMGTEKMMNTNSKSPGGSSEKRKRKSVDGFAKCTSKGGGIDYESLIGCRIKVWWPMDKQFYEGMIKSYDDNKRKHVILYEDGDVEVLCLDKERWELVDKGRKHAKKLISSKCSGNPELSSGQKNKKLGGSQKKSMKTVNGKQRERKSVKHLKSGVSRLDEEIDEESSEIPMPEAATTSKVDVGSGEQAESMDEIVMDESDKKLKFLLKGKRSKVERRHTEDSYECKPGLEGRHSEGESQPSNAQNGDQGSGLKEVDESDGTPRREAKVSDSEGNKVGLSPREMDKSNISTHIAKETEISDDVPLSKWKHRSGKKSSKQAQ